MNSKCAFLQYPKNVPIFFSSYVLLLLEPPVKLLLGPKVMKRHQKIMISLLLPRLSLHKP